MSKLVEVGGRLIHLSEIDPHKAQYQPGDTVYAVWPFYRPGLPYVYEGGSFGYAKFTNPRAAAPDNYFFDWPEHFRRFW